MSVEMWKQIKPLTNLSERYKHLKTYLTGNGELTPLQIAAATDGLDECRRLVLSGANLDVRCNATGATVMHFVALNENCLSLVHFFTLYGLKVDAKDKQGAEPVNYALNVGNVEVAKELLKWRSSDAEDSKNNLLHFLVMQNNLRSAKLVLREESDVLFELGEFGNNAFLLACRDASLEMCKWLLGEGLNPRARSKDKSRLTALHLAGFNTRHGGEVVRFLVSILGFDVNARDSQGNTPLHYALRFENVSVATQLALHGVDWTVRSKGENLLHFCVRRNLPTSARFVHEKNPLLLLEQIGPKGENALQIAAMGGADWNLCLWLMEKSGLGPQAVKQQKSGKNLLHYAACNKSHGADIISNLATADYGLDLNQKDADGLSPICYAVKAGNVAAVEELARRWADLKLKVNKDENLMHLCVRGRVLQCAKYLHSRCPALVKEQNRKGMSMLHFAAQHADVDFCKWLAEDCGLDARQPSSGKWNTAVHYAAKNLSHGKELVNYFALSFSLNLEETNMYGQTPLYYARKIKNDDAAKELKRLKKLRKK